MTCSACLTCHALGTFQQLDDQRRTSHRLDQRRGVFDVMGEYGLGNAQPLGAQHLEAPQLVAGSYQRLRGQGGEGLHHLKLPDDRTAVEGHRGANSGNNRVDVVHIAVIVSNGRLALLGDDLAPHMIQDQGAMSPRDDGFAQAAGGIQLGIARQDGDFHKKAFDQGAKSTAWAGLQTALSSRWDLNVAINFGQARRRYEEEVAAAVAGGRVELRFPEFKGLIIQFVEEVHHPPASFTAAFQQDDGRILTDDRLHFGYDHRLVALDVAFEEIQALEIAKQLATALHLGVELHGSALIVVAVHHIMLTSSYVAFVGHRVVTQADGLLFSAQGVRIKDHLRKTTDVFGKDLTHIRHRLYSIHPPRCAYPAGEEYGDVSQIGTDIDADIAPAYDLIEKIRIVELAIAAQQAAIESHKIHLAENPQVVAERQIAVKPLANPVAESCHRSAGSRLYAQKGRALRYGQR